MAMAFIGIAFLVASVPMMAEFYADKIEEGEVYTNVKIAAGDTLANETAFNTGGNAPSIALWAQDGHKIGTYSADSDEVIHQGVTSKEIKVHHGDTDPPNTGDQAEYILLSAAHDDAICIAFITLKGTDGVDRAWYGDVGYSCGGNWYASRYKINDQNYMPRCTWLDKNHSKELKHRAMGIHLMDFTATDARAQQYQDNKASMCDSQPRFWLYPDMKPEGILPIYFPPLEQNQDLTDKDPDAVAKNQGIPGGDPKMELPDDVNVAQGKRKRSGIDSPPRPVRKRWTNPPDSRFQGKVIMSTHEGHSAKELCEHDTSAGPDFVSYSEGLFCDMSEKKLWPLCDGVGGNQNQGKGDSQAPTEQQQQQQQQQQGNGNNQAATRQQEAGQQQNNGKRDDQSQQQTSVSCFDTRTKTMRGAGPHRRDESIPVKQYQNAEIWDESNMRL